MCTTLRQHVANAAAPVRVHKNWILQHCKANFAGDYWGKIKAQFDKAQDVDCLRVNANVPLQGSMWNLLSAPGNYQVGRWDGNSFYDQGTAIGTVKCRAFVDGLYMLDGPNPAWAAVLKQHVQYEGRDKDRSYFAVKFASDHLVKSPEGAATACNQRRQQLVLAGVANLPDHLHYIHANAALDNFHQQIQSSQELFKQIPKDLAGTAAHKKGRQVARVYLISPVSKPLDVYEFTLAPANTYTAPAGSTQMKLVYMVQPFGSIWYVYHLVKALPVNTPYPVVWPWKEREVTHKSVTMKYFVEYQRPV